ncbi:MAG: hypothetical protein AAF978_08955, partial [Cyanobacteria bacterium P01_E01_bin.48]
MSSHSTFPTPYPINWTPEKVEFFWNWYSQSAERQSEYFGEKMAASVVEVIRRTLPPPAKVLDFGCGTGKL